MDHIFEALLQLNVVTEETVSHTHTLQIIIWTMFLAELVPMESKPQVNSLLGENHSCSPLSLMWLDFRDGTSFSTFLWEFGGGGGGAQSGPV